MLKWGKQISKKRKARLRSLSTFLSNFGGYFMENIFVKVILMFGTSALCASVTNHRQWCYTLTQEWSADLRAPCHFWYLALPILSLFVPYWPIYGSLRVKIPLPPQKTNKMQSVWAIVYFFKNGAHVSFPEERGERLLLHLPFFDKHTPASCLPLSPSLSASLHLSPFRSPSLVFTFPILKCEMRGGSQDNWPCVSRVVWSRNAAEATHLRAAQQTVKCSTGGRTRLQRERGTRAV